MSPFSERRRPPTRVLTSVSDSSAAHVPAYDLSRFPHLIHLADDCLSQGVKFEPSSFKLSHEMVVLMGGRNSVGFRQFSELTVKAFLACRPYGQAVVDTSSLMMAAEFPSFKGEPTITRLAERFRLDLSEAEAAEYMKGVIENACENPRSIVYDEFQRLTNGEIRFE